MTISREQKNVNESKLILSSSKIIPSHNWNDLICFLTQDYIARSKKYSNIIEIINIKTGKIEKQLKDEEGKKFTAMVWDGKRIMTASQSDEYLMQWDIDTSEGVMIPFKNLYGIEIIKLFLLPNRQLISFDVWCQVKLLDLDKGTSHSLFSLNRLAKESVKYNDVIVTDHYVIGIGMKGESIDKSEICIYNLSSNTFHKFDVDGHHVFAVSDDIIAVSTGCVHPGRVDFYDFQDKKLGCLQEPTRGFYQVCALPTGQFCCFTYEFKKPCVCYLVDPRSDQLIQQKDTIDLINVGLDLRFNPINGHLMGILSQAAKYFIYDLDIGFKEKYEQELQSSLFGKQFQYGPGIVFKQLGLFSKEKLSEEISNYSAGAHLIP